MKGYNYKCVVSNTGTKRYYKSVNGKWKHISNKLGLKAEKGKKKYGMVGGWRWSESININKSVTSREDSVVSWNDFEQWVITYTPNDVSFGPVEIIFGFKADLFGTGSSIDQFTAIQPGYEEYGKIDWGAGAPLSGYIYNNVGNDSINLNWVSHNFIYGVDHITIHNGLMTDPNTITGQYGFAPDLESLQQIYVLSRDGRHPSVVGWDAIVADNLIGGTFVAKRKIPIRVTGGGGFIQPPPTVTGDINGKFECKICLDDDKKYMDGVRVYNCGHYVCMDCGQGAGNKCPICRDQSGTPEDLTGYTKEMLEKHMTDNRKKLFHSFNR